MRILIVDNSNTRTKFALADGDQLDPWRAIIATPEISPNSLEECLADISWDVSIISSVVPQKAAILAEKKAEILAAKKAKVLMPSLGPSPSP